VVTPSAREEHSDGSFCRKATAMKNTQERWPLPGNSNEAYTGVMAPAWQQQ